MKSGKKTKLDRVFGDDAVRIRIEADRMIKGGKKGGRK
jgi:hypothetical protein